AAAGVVETVFGVGRQRINGLRLRAAEIEGHPGSDARVECGRDGGWVAAASHGAEENDSLLVDACLAPEQIDTAPQTPDHPADQALAGEVELQGNVVAEVVILPAEAERFRKLVG